MLAARNRGVAMAVLRRGWKVLGSLVVMGLWPLIRTMSLAISTTRIFAPIMCSPKPNEFVDSKGEGGGGWGGALDRVTSDSGERNVA